LITHNKGATWEPIKPPTKTSKGKKISCFIEDGCSLHFEIYSAQGEHSPVYSAESATGVIIGTGNLGEYLSPNGEGKNLYLSRDGGMTWASTHKGNYIYEIADHGALIVASKLRNPTKIIEFTWDYGKTWERVEIADRNMEIHNIISEPRATS